MGKLPVAVCMISGAEARRIGRALGSVSGWTSEVVVVLNEEVSDGTEAMALEHGAKVFREPWQGWVRQKNSAAQKASQPWLLGLDADEEVPPALREEITRTLADRNLAERYAAFDFPRCSCFCGRWIRHGDWYPNRVTRLWKRGAAVWAGEGLHERLEVAGRVGHLRHDLNHYPVESMQQLLAKLGRYGDTFARTRLGRRSGWFDLVVRPWWRFVRAYVLRGGFLDGWQGCYIAWWVAFYTATRYAKVREAQTASGLNAGNSPTHAQPQP